MHIYFSDAFPKFHKSVKLLEGVFSVVALPLETVMIPLFASELFGNKDFDKVLGVFIAANYAGYALGAPLGNLCYDVFGSYNVSFVIFGILMIFASVAMQFSIVFCKPRQKENFSRRH